MFHDSELIHRLAISIPTIIYLAFNTVLHLMSSISTSNLLRLRKPEKTFYGV